MPHHPPIQLLGEILQEAALISAAQLEVVLRDQQSYQLPLGEILHLRGWLNQKTADFFVEQWSSLLHNSSRHPLGYYFQLASLLETEQINAILQEQKQMGIRFGTVAVVKGWLKKETVDYFVKNLVFQSKGRSGFQDTNQVLFSEQMTFMKTAIPRPKSIFISQSLLNDPNLRLSLGNEIVCDGGTYRKNVGAVSQSSRNSGETLLSFESEEEIPWID
jgi:hypothetical protein